MSQTKEDVLRKELNEALDISTQRIALLDKIRARRSKKATSAELAWLNTHAVEPLSDDMVALMLEAKADKRQQKGLMYRPFLIVNGSQSDREFDFKIKELIKNKQPFHYDCIIKTGGHCSPMQLEFDGESLRIFYLDSTKDSRNFGHATFFQNIHNKVEFYHYSKGGIQADDTSCSIFSLQNLNALSNASLDDKKRIHTHIMSLLDPVFLKNAQSTSFLNDYYNSFPDATVDKKKTKTLKEHIDQYSITVNTAKSTLGWLVTKNKTQNHAITYKTHKYLLAVRDKLDEITANQIPLRDVIANRKSYCNKNILAPNTDDTKLLSRMLNSYVKENNLFGIKEHVFFAIDHEEHPDCLKALSKAGIGESLSDAITWLHKNRVNLNERNEEGNTLLIAAILFDKIEVINKLSELGISMKNPATDGWTPATFAAGGGKLHIINRLIELGVDFSAPMKNGITPIFTAVENGHIEVVKRLQELGIDLNPTKPDDGLSPAFLAAQKGHTEIMELLFNTPGYQAIPFTSTSDSLKDFAKEHNTMVIKRMDKFISKHKPSASGKLSLMPADIAAIMGHQDIVTMIHENTTSKYRNAIRTDANKPSRHIFGFK